MYSRPLCVVLVFSLCMMVLAEEKKAPARSISTGGPSQEVTAGGPLKPIVIRNKEDLARAYPDEKARQAILRQVDLSTEQLLLFVWLGAGGDQIVVDSQTSKTGEVIFRYFPASTPAIYRNARLFAMAAGGKWKVIQGR